jgi:hypothetical protein
MDNKNEKPKVVATIDVNVQWPPKVSKKAWLEESVDDHLQCVLCGTQLTFKHKTDFLANTVHEEAHCASCGVRNRQSTYSLQ